MRRDPTAPSSGQEVTVEVTVPARSLALWDGETHAWTIEQGVFRLIIGSSYSDERLAIEVSVTPIGSPDGDTTSQPSSEA
jgi:hypothetical protein